MEKKIILSTLLALVLLVFGYTLTFNGVKSEEKIILGAIQPLTKGSAAVAEEVKAGIDFAVNEINSKGGVSGKKLEILYEDDECDQKLAINAFEKLTSVNGLKIIIGPTCSSNVLSVAPLANEKKVIILTTVASTPQITHAGDYVFRNTPSGKDYSYLIADFAYNKLGARTTSSLYINLDNGIDYKKEFAKRFSELGGKILNEESYEKADTDFRAQLTKIKNQNPDVIFVSGQINHGLAVKQAREIGIQTQIVGPTALQTPDFLTAAGSAAEGVLYSAPKFDKTSPAVKDFENKFKQKYNKTIGFRTVIAYDAVFIIAEALKKCEQDVECVKMALYNTKNYEGLSGLTSFDENGDVEKPLTIMTVKNGKFVEYTN